jgi:hypothetical protein
MYGYNRTTISDQDRFHTEDYTDTVTTTKIDPYTRKITLIATPVTIQTTDKTDKTTLNTVYGETLYPICQQTTQLGGETETTQLTLTLLITTIITKTIITRNWVKKQVYT